MAKSLAQLSKQIATLQAQAERLRMKEVAEVVARVKAAIKHYDLTAADLGLSGRMPTKKTPVSTPKPTKARRKPSKIKYRDETGNEWTGRGRRPRWFLDALAAGKTPEQLST